MKRTREEVATTIEGFVNGTGKQWDWDGFTSIRIDDPELEKLRQRCISVRDEFPPDKATDYCSPAGMEMMRKLAGGITARGGWRAPAQTFRRNREKHLLERAPPSAVSLNQKK